MIKQVTIDLSTDVSHAHLLEPQENMIELVSKEVKEKEKESLNDNEWIYSSTWFELGGKDIEITKRFYNEVFGGQFGLSERDANMPHYKIKTGVDCLA
ncbi:MULTISPECIES: hypothetical protein [Bacillus cereus group]|uniref:hypothetical protein n=1 Tax=Bacillus cereus group TaxID=86661 RepID=UPI000B4A4E5A|nr:MULTISPECIES: hypothetical protein [Bacillus cereus group]MDH4423800.1 hypothetical protein [Bacillus cereus]